MSKDSINSKNILTVTSFMAETASEADMVRHLKKGIDRYHEAKLRGSPENELSKIYQDITILCYVVIVKTLGKPTAELIKNVEDIDRVIKLIEPNQN